ncbi:MAG: bifunctional 4-hydroxy-3-methylbut-2-enyl diphosphate reductase/30S ribosomal protein S1 [Candidatus Faecousia sp.]|nr:bifunctional 4-hydroxy-3-methylbut-2-enyl diphosphate reductase/30S ribosomal protein S1 [Clostridiales bacterium]MDY6181842.1 bifunctional 4-hydroxy-3-methylbut-2-enyl diphosphate reductase/30S ribosomal protein S1 [Candidatus Faecousia sp.]
MSVTVAQSAGFCFGVSRAVELVEQAARAGKRVVTLGPIIHNRHVVEKFASLGIRVIETPEEAAPGETVIIRSHGVARDICRRLEARGVEVIDATCPFVKRIHGIVSRAEEEGRLPVIIGTPTHPEVEGIAGWCGDCRVFRDAEELEKWVRECEIPRDLAICMVSQTTSTESLWKLCGEFAKKQFTNLKIFDTICKATEYRQSEAAQLSQKSQAMVVVGDPKSSNTGRLAMICREHCDRVFQVDCAADLNPMDFRGVTDVGITAGASTPAWIIKEVNKTMSEITNVEAVQEENFAELLEQSIKTLNTGDKVIGTVTGIGNTEVQVDLGTKHAGYIPYDEVSTDPSVKPEDVLKVGDEIEVFVVRVNDQEGTVQLSKKKLDGLKVWDDMAAYAEDKTTVEGTITEENKGGLVCNVKGIRVFIPASQSGIAKGGDMAGMVGKTVQLKITEVNRARRRVIGSIRAVTSEARKAAQEKIWAEIENGKKYHGVVKSLTSYGAFVDIGGVDGMVHVSELSWNRIKTPADVVKVGDEIDVYVISFDPEKHKISLGYKTAEMNPWNQFMTNYHVGDVVEAKVVKLMTFGAFAEILPGVDGLIHISQIADRRIGKPEDALSEGQVVRVKITDVDAENKRISLSIRALLEESGDAE